MSLDPRTKILSTILVNVVLLISTNLFVISLIAMIYSLILLIRRYFVHIVGGMRGWLLVLYIAFLINAYYNGFLVAITMVLRFYAIIASTQALYATTSQNDIIKAFISLGISREYTLAFSIAFRFIPVISEDAIIMYDALQAKKVKLSFFNKIKYAVAYIAAIINRSIDRIFAVAENLEIRGLGKYKTELSMRMMDYIVLSIVFLFLILVVIDTYFYSVFSLFIPYFSEKFLSFFDVFFFFNSYR